MQGVRRQVRQRAALGATWAQSQHKAMHAGEVEAAAVCQRYARAAPARKATLWQWLGVAGVQEVLVARMPALWAVQVRSCAAVTPGCNEAAW